MANELSNIVNFCLLLITLDCIKPLRGISGQDRGQIPWEYPRKAKSKLDTLKKCKMISGGGLQLPKSLLAFGSCKKIFRSLKNLHSDIPNTKNNGATVLKSLHLTEECPNWLTDKDYKGQTSPSTSSTDDDAPILSRTRTSLKEIKLRR